MVGCTNNVPKRIFVMQSIKGSSREQVWWNLLGSIAHQIFFGWINRNFSSAAEEKRTKFQTGRLFGAGENCELFYLRRS